MSKFELSFRKRSSLYCDTAVVWRPDQNAGASQLASIVTESKVHQEIADARTYMLLQ